VKYILQIKKYAKWFYKRVHILETYQMENKEEKKFRGGRRELLK